MKLVIKCEACNEENRSPVKGTTRINIVRKYGEQVKMTCKNCSNSTDYEVDDIKAVDYKFSEILLDRILVFLIVVSVAFISGIFLIGPEAGFILSIISMFISLMLVKKNSSQKVLTFNRHKVKNRISGI